MVPLYASNSVSHFTISLHEKNFYVCDVCAHSACVFVSVHINYAHVCSV